MLSHHATPRTRRLTGLVCAILGSLCLSGNARAAEDIDYAAIFKTHILRCLHATANVDKTVVEIMKGPTHSGDTDTTRLKVFYPGMLTKKSMELDVMVRRAGSIRQLKVNVLADTGMEVGSCGLTKQWADF